MKKLLIAGLLLLILNSAYLFAYGTPSLFYMINVLFHVALGLVLIPPFIISGLGIVKQASDVLGPRCKFLAWLAYDSMIVCIVTGISLIVVGNTRPNHWILWLHIFSAVLSILLLFICLNMARTKTVFTKQWTGLWRLGLGIAAFGIVFPLVALTIQQHQANPNDIIRNPLSPPLSMEQESMLGKEGPFFPSAAETNTGGLISASFFMDSKSCGQSGCHPDVVEQWEASAHHFSSFNNQWYRKSIEYMQEVVGVEPSKWCAGCHDQALLFSGMFDRPVEEILDTPEAHAGIGCNGCHAIGRIKDSMGNGGYVIEYPPLHDLATSDNPVIQFLHNFLIRVDPEPHRRTFLKPFLREQTAEFCSSCHKVHLDKPVNHYRWLRGFNTYDNWQASGVSGQGARSFYYPEKPQKCVECHMPLTPSRDAGNIKGFVHNHRFPGANTALPVANRDAEQLKVTTDFLKDKQVSVDIFAMTEPGKPTLPGGTAAQRSSAEPRLSSSFAIGEEQGMAVGVGGGTTGPAEKIIAPLESSNAFVRHGDTLRLDVVVRTLKVGHFFPTGTVDAFDVWLELKAVDNRGDTLFWSGAVADDGKGAVEPGAHFYRSFMLDAHGNPINKRNAWATRATLYVNLIPPGAADVARFRLLIPEDCGESIQVTAKLNYRKFDWWHTQFAYAGVPDPNATAAQVSPHFDDRRWSFTGDLTQVSGSLKEIPILPIVEMTRDRLDIKVLSAGMELPHVPTTHDPDSRRRWNDYGIGLLRQGDTKGAERAFRTVTQLDPDYVDGWVNVARAQLREGNIDGAEESLGRALAMDPKLAKSRYFYGLALKSRGDYDAAHKQFHLAADSYPRDRVVLNQIGRVHFLKKEYQAAVNALQKVLAIDPEDLQAHYNLMLSYRGLGDMKNAKREQALYLRFKADESAQIITGQYRQKDPDANNERQPIHEHHSVPLPWGSEAESAEPLSAAY